VERQLQLVAVALIELFLGRQQLVIPVSFFVSVALVVLVELFRRRAFIRLRRRQQSVFGRRQTMSKKAVIEIQEGKFEGVSGKRAWVVVESNDPDLIEGAWTGTADGMLAMHVDDFKPGTRVTVEEQDG
jgi:hypothetical protein